MLKKVEQEANYVAPGDRSDNQVYPSHLSPRQHIRVAQLVGSKCSVNCHLDGQAVTAFWVTGAQVSIVSETFMYKQSLTSKLRNVEELLGVQGKIELKAANGTPIPYCGWIELSVRSNETQPDILVPFLVTKENIGPPIIGFNVIELIVKEANSISDDTGTFVNAMKKSFGSCKGEKVQFRKHNIEDKIHCTASKLHETWLKCSLAIDHYVKVQQLDDICETRR
jgi:hypothetical protein